MRIFRWKTKPKDPPWIVIGLGNPGPKYVDSRHNVGFAVVDHWAHLNKIDLHRKRQYAFVGEGLVGSDDGPNRVVVAKPLTFMNMSGDAAIQLLARYRGRPDRMVVILDDVDLPLGRLRVRDGGSAGGHNGLASVIQKLGTDSFLRIRVGIGRPNGENMIEHVLTNFAAEEKDKIYSAIMRAADCIHWILTHGPNNAMNEFNGV